MHRGAIPDETIAAVLKSHDIVEVVGKYVHLTKQGKYFKGLCPFHSEKTPSFTVSPDKQIFHCFGCGASGHAIKFVMEIEGLSFPEAVAQLAEEAGIPVDWRQESAEETEDQRQRRHMAEGHEFAAKLYHYLLKNSEQGKPGMAYLRQRGFSDKLIDAFQIGYAPPQWDTLAKFMGQRAFRLDLMEQGGLLSRRSEGDGYVDRFRDRIMFPIHDAKGRSVAFGGRILGDGQPKYLNTSETKLFNKSRLLYNLHQAKAEIRKSGTVVLFEGYVDVIKSWDAGVRNGVATMGTALSEEHARILKRLAERVVICYDGDAAGQNAAYKSLSLLEKHGLETLVAVLPDKLDPDEFITARGGERFLAEIIEGAVAAAQFKLLYVRRNHNLSTDDGKLRYIRSALQIVAELGSPTEREHYLKQLSSEFQYGMDTLNHELHLIREELQKKRQPGDNNNAPWNNGRNDRTVRASAPPLMPAYYNAEMRLLSAMMEDRELAELVRERLGDGFNVEAHAALAAYLYAYYAQGNEPNHSRFIASLHDNELERAAGQISLLDSSEALNDQAIEDCIRQIKRVPQIRAIDSKKQEMLKAERARDYIGAARIASEIIALERQLKSL